jgi:hypothetical protein
MSKAGAKPLTMADSPAWAPEVKASWAYSGACELSGLATEDGWTAGGTVWYEILPVFQSRSTWTADDSRSGTPPLPSRPRTRAIETRNWLTFSNGGTA